MGQEISALATTPSLSITWSNEGAEGGLIIMREALAVNKVPTDGVGYTGNTVFGSGSNLGDANYVVNSTLGVTSVIVTDLTPNTVYHITGFGITYVDGSPVYEQLFDDVVDNPINTSSIACVFPDTSILCQDRDTKLNSAVAIRDLHTGDMVFDGQMNLRKIKHVIRFKSQSVTRVVIIPAGHFNDIVPTQDLFIRSSHPMTHARPSSSLPCAYTTFGRGTKYLKDPSYIGMLRSRDYANREPGIIQADYDHQEYYNIVLFPTSCSFSSNTIIANGIIIETLPEVSKYNWETIGTVQ